jgi:uncharacterized membrane protein
VVADAEPTPTTQRHPGRDPPRAPAQPQAAPNQPGMSTVVHRNIRSLVEVRQRDEQRRGVSERIADAVTAFAGSMWCVYVHAALFGGWIVINLGWVPGVKPFDPFPFVMLAMFASVEAIFLSTFILISQNRAQRLADRRAELDLHISLLTEHELTRAIQMIDDVARRMGAARPPENELEDIKKDVIPEKVAEEIERAHG